MGPLIVANYKDCVKDHDHITGFYRGVADNEFNFKLKLDSKKFQLPVIFHNLGCYDAHLLMQAMARAPGEIECIPNNRKIDFIFSREREIH